MYKEMIPEYEQIFNKMVKYCIFNDEDIIEYVIENS